MAAEAEEEVVVDEVDSGTEADGAAEVVTTTRGLLMQRVATKLLPPPLLLLLLLAEKLDKFARRILYTFCGMASPRVAKVAKTARCKERTLPMS